MTANCANPACKLPFHYFRSGTIYLLDPRDGTGPQLPSDKAQRTEYFWLCGECSRKMRLVRGRDGTASLQTITMPGSVVPFERKPSVKLAV